MNTLREVTRRSILSQSLRRATSASLQEWRPVHDRETGLTYYWNPHTGTYRELAGSGEDCALDETTALGAVPPDVEPHSRFAMSRSAELMQMGVIGFGFGLVIAVIHKIL